MGNAAAKELSETPLAKGSFDESNVIAPSLLSTEEITIKNKGSKWVVVEDGKMLWTSKQKGIIKSHGIVQDSEDNVLAIIVTEKSGIASITNIVCKSTPSYDGQEPMTDDELKKAGIEEGTTLYKFSKIDTVRKMTTAKCEYTLFVKEGGEPSVLMTAEKLSAMGFMALFKQGDTCVAKASTPGMSMSPMVEAAPGVDLLAVVCIGYSLAGNGNSAGALAGAGVV